MAMHMLDCLLLTKDLSRSYLEDARRIKPFPLPSGGASGQSHLKYIRAVFGGETRVRSGEPDRAQFAEPWF
jgi:hypothetical protein